MRLNILNWFRSYKGNQTKENAIIVPNYKVAVGEYEVENIRSAIEAYTHDTDIYNAINFISNAALSQGFYCMPPWQEIITSEGLKPISEIRSGDLVLTHKGRFQEVKRVFSREETKGLLKIRVKGSPFDTFLTAEHPVLCRKQVELSHSTLGSRGGRVLQGFQWVKSSELRVEESYVNQFYPCFPILGQSDILEAGQNVADEALTVAGYYLAEGYVYVGKRKPPRQSMQHLVCFTFGNKKLIEFSYVGHLVSALLALGHKAYVYDQGSSRKVFVSSEQLASWLVDNFGKLAHGKKLPAWVLNLPPERAGILFQAYINGDGTRDFHKGCERTRASTVSKNLAVGLKLLALKLGMKTTITVATRNPVRFPGHAEFSRLLRCYEVVFSELGRIKQMRSDREFIYPKIKSIDSVPYNGTVFDLEVEEDHSFCTSSFVVSNCTGDESYKGGKVVDLIEDFNSSIRWGNRRGEKGLASLLRIVTKELLYGGNTFIEMLTPKNLQMLNQVELSSIYKVYRNEVGDVSKIQQLIGGRLNDLDPDTIIHVPWLQVDREAFGRGLIQPLIAPRTDVKGKQIPPLYVIKASLEYDLYRMVHRRGVPRSLFSFPSAGDELIQSYAKALEDPDIDTSFTTNTKVDIAVEQGGPAQGISNLIAFLDKRFQAGLQTPINNLLNSSGYTEASARVSEELGGLIVKDLQMRLKQAIETELYERIITQAGLDPKKAKIELHWGSRIE
ncbi:MAG: hypothetical protein JRN67_08555, partial [Nitrososphaerota archaeon]|nr:hypothetical protein [Nitrososphaerota archaeon]